MDKIEVCYYKNQSEYYQQGTRTARYGTSAEALERIKKAGYFGFIGWIQEYRKPATKLKRV
jgi:hypothetical protein